jgi:alpha-tubulin suppressor-like RCC1 family protein
MNTKLRNIAICILTLSLSISGCRPTRFVSIAAGALHTCVLTSAGGVKCWGSNESGQLGDGTTITRTTPVDVSGLPNGVRAIAVGDSHTCGLTSSGGVKCWGSNDEGQLGDGSTINRSTPVDVSGLTNGVKSIVAGAINTCALTASGGVKCWGWKNTYAEGGDITSNKRLIPETINGLTSGVKAIAAGTAHTCILTSAGGVKCWGSNGDGQLGDGTYMKRATPVDVIGLTGGVAAIAANGYQTCALTLSGGVKCWGINIYGTWGDGISTPTNYTTPVDINGLISDISMIDMGGTYMCVLTLEGGVKCRGDNRQGQLGDGTTTQQSTPIDVEGLESSIIDIATGSLHTCALTSADKIKCWGANFTGQLGDGTTTQKFTPVDVSSQ